MTRSPVSTLALLCLLGGAGCQENSSPSPIALEDFCPALAAAVCDGIEACCESSTSASKPCLTREARFCEDFLLSEDDLAGTTPDENLFGRVLLLFDEEGAGRAVAAMQSAAASCSEPHYPRFAEVHSLQPEGKLCVSDEDCLEQLHCVSLGGIYGACRTAPREGQACASRCQPGLLCLADGEGGRVCSEPRKAGQSCASLIECEQGTYCAGTVVTGMKAQGVCVVQASNGTRCSSDVQCKSSYCENQTTCSNPEPFDPSAAWCVPPAALSGS